VAAAGRPDLLTAAVPPSCTVLIAAPELLPALKERAAAAGGDVLAFTDAEALRALEVITAKRPDVVSLDRLFAATSRGAALINRIKADPALTRSEVRVVSEDTGALRASAPPRGAEPLPPTVQVAAEDALDAQGTRRVPRVAVTGGFEVLIDGNPATLVDVSVAGMQVVSPTVMKPNQRVRMVLSDDEATVRANGTVAWASFEIPAGSGPRYRAGIELLTADLAALRAFCLKQQA
jgi:hypothetical protein